MPEAGVVGRRVTEAVLYKTPALRVNVLAQNDKPGRSAGFIKMLFNCPGSMRDRRELFEHLILDPREGRFTTRLIEQGHQDDPLELVDVDFFVAF